MVTKLVVIRYIMSQSKGPQVPVLWGRHRSVRWGCVRPHYHLVIFQKRKNHWFKPSAPTHHEAGTYFSRMPMILASSVRLTDLPVSRAVSNVRFAELPTPLHKLTPWGPTCVWRWTTLQPTMHARKNLVSGDTWKNKHVCENGALWIISAKPACHRTESLIQR